MITIQVVLASETFPDKFNIDLYRQDVLAVMKRLNDCTGDFLQWKYLAGIEAPEPSAVCTVWLQFAKHPRWPEKCARLDDADEAKGRFYVEFDPRENWDLRGWRWFRLGGLEFKWFLLHELTHIAFRNRHTNDATHYMHPEVPVRKWDPMPHGTMPFIRKHFAQWAARHFSV